MPESSTLESLPTIVLASVALGSALLWQVAGTLAIFRLTPPSLSRPWRLALAWLSWLPVSGGAALALVMLGIVSRTVLLLGAPTVLALALTSWREVRPLVADARAAWQRWSADAQPFERWLCRVGVGLQVIGWAFAAHPQKIYDQLNYHLVVGHLVVRDGQPFSAWDPHVTFAGVVEYALAWHAAWSDSRLLFVGTAQVAVMLATVPILIWCGLELGRASLGLFGLLLVALPGLIPESVILHMAKPDGVVLTGVVVLLTLLVRAPSGWPWAAAAVSGMLFAAKLTFGHALLGLGAALLVARPPRGRMRDWWPLLAAGTICLVLQLAKNYSQLGNPFYPAVAALFPSPASDATTAGYWSQVAYGGGSHLMGWLGPFLLVHRGTGLFLSVVVAAALVVSQRRNALSSGVGEQLSYRGIAAFLVTYWLTWPLFYGGFVLPRFVASFAGGLFVLLLLLHANLGAVARRRLQLVCAVAGILSAHLDRSLPGLVRWNVRSAYEAFAMEWPRLRTATALNPLLSTTDAIIADKPEKLFFDARLLFEAPLSPQERAVLEELRHDPVPAAARHHVKAIIVDANRPMGPLLQEVWQGLEASGRIRNIGPDRVLWSSCYFQEPCVDSDT